MNFTTEIILTPIETELNITVVELDEEISFDHIDFVVEVQFLEGLQGIPGKQIELGKSSTYLQWRYVGDTAWINLTPLSDITGANGKSCEFQVSATHIQWRVVGDTDWIDLIALSEFKGDKGDPFTYDDFTPEQIAELQQPALSAAAIAIEAAGQVNDVIVIAEQTIDDAEQATINANNAAVQLVDGAETDYNTLKKLQDKLKAVEAIIGDAAGDDDNLIDTVRELLAVFSTFPEGSDMATLLTAKVNVSDIYNALDCIIEGKVLDARQGKVLSNAIVSLQNELSNHDHAGQSLNPDYIVLDEEYTDTTMTALPVGSLFYNVDQLAWLLKTTATTYLNLGEENTYIAKNNDAVTHLEGQVTYVTSGGGNLDVMTLASSANGKIDALATQDVLHTGNGRGMYCFGGKVRTFPYANVKKSTDNENTWVEGAELYLCSEAGRYSTAKEAAPAKCSVVGKITQRNGANISVSFRPFKAIAVSDLSDVDGTDTTIADTDVILKKDASVWKSITWANVKTLLATWANGLYAKLSGGNTFDGEQSMLGGIKAAKIYPNADSTTAVQIMKADKTTPVVSVDTANGNVGIGTNSTSFLLNLYSNTNSAQVALRGAVNTMYWGGDWGIGYLTATKIQFKVSNIVAVNIGTNGGLRVGDSTEPETKLDINGTTTFRDYTYYNNGTHTGDAVGDFRSKVLSGVLTVERCTVANATTKGGGTWVVDMKILADGSKQFGNDTNNVKIDPNGTIKLNGTATVFDDLKASALSLQQTGAGVSQNIPELTVEYTTASDLSDYMVQSLQMPHTWKIASNVFPHIHFRQSSAGIPNFLLQYRWQVNGQAEKTAWTNYKCNTPSFTYVSGNLNQICYGAALTPPANATLSDIVEFRIIRDNANTSGVFAGADPVASTARVRSFDIHYEIDQLGGSNDEYIK